MDKNTKKKAPPLAAIYTFRRSNTLPFCRITGKSHSMDEHHYIPCMDDFPKFEHHSGCRITEKHEYFKDYKFAYPIIDLDGSTRMVTEHDFHCRITAKYRAMAGHKYLYPVLGATTDKKASDMVSVVEEERMRDVLIPKEVEMIVKGGVEDVLKMKENEYLFIYSKEGAIIPAAMKEIRGRGGAKQGRRHTLPAGLEAGVSSDLEEFRRSLGIKMIGEIKNPPAEVEGPPSLANVFDKIQEEVEVLKDVRKSRPKRPGKHTHKPGEGNQKRIKTDDKSKDMTGKENIIEESKEEDVPPPKMSRMERYKMQFSSFESSATNIESGNRLTLMGAFDESEVVELDFGEPTKLEISNVEVGSGNFSTAVISDEPMCAETADTLLNSVDTSNIHDTSGKTNLQTPSSVSEIVESDVAFDSISENARHNISVAKGEGHFQKLVENVELSINGNSRRLDGLETSNIESKKIEESLADMIASDKSIETTSYSKKPGLSEKHDSASNKCFLLNDGNTDVVSASKSDVNVSSQKSAYIMNHYVAKVEYSDSLSRRENFEMLDIQDKRESSVNAINAKSTDYFREMMEVDDKFHQELTSISTRMETQEEGNLFRNESSGISKPTILSETEECIIPKKVSCIPQSNASKNLMNELKMKLSSGSKKRSSEVKTVTDTFPAFENKSATENGAEGISNQINSKKIEKLNEFKKEETKDIISIDMKVDLGKKDQRILSLNGCTELTEPVMVKASPCNDFEMACVLQDRNVGKSEGSEFGENGFTESSSVNKIKLENPIDVSKSKLKGTDHGHVKLSPPEKSLSTSVNVHNESNIKYCYSNGVPEEVSKNTLEELSSAMDSKNEDQDFEKYNYAKEKNNLTRETYLRIDETGKFEQIVSKEIDVSKSQSLKFNSENIKSIRKTRSELVDSSEKKNLLLESDNFDSKEIGNLKNQSSKSAIEKNNEINLTRFESSNKTSHTMENDVSNGQMTSFGIDIGKKSEFELSHLKSRETTSDAGKVNIPPCVQPDLNNRDRSPIPDLPLDDSLSNKVTKVNPEFELGSNGVDPPTKLPMSVESQFPSSKVDGSFPECNGLHMQPPVTRKHVNGELSFVSGGENIPLSAADDKNVGTEREMTAEGVKGDDKQWQGIDVYVAIMDFKPMTSDEEAVSMKEGQRVEVIDASKPRRWLVRTIPMVAEECSQEGWVPACYLEKSTAFDTLSSYVVTEAELDPKELEALQNREAIVKELVETEEDFAKDMQYVVENYYKQMDNPRLPKEFRDRKGSVFGNFKDISDFHNNVLMKGVNYHAKEPTKLGKTFLRLERDFDMHASYCWNEARAQRLLREGPLKEFFDDHSRMIDDDKLLADHLKLPIQRLNDYQLLLKELIKYSSRLNEDTADLQKALDFIHSINSRTKDLQYILAIEGCKGDLLKIGRIIKHEVFDVCEGSEVSASERYVFLFKGRVFVTEKRIASEKESYHVTNLFRLQDVDLQETVDGDPLKVVFKSHKKSRPGFPLSLRARSLEQKNAWCKELLTANQVVEDLGDLEPSLEHPLAVTSTEQLIEKVNDIVEKAENEKSETVSLKRQDSVKKPTKTPDSSVPQTPTETDSPRPSLKRQESVKKPKKSGDTSAPDTPTESSEKPPKLARQDSKKSKADSSAPETPTEVPDKRPKLSRQDSKKSKSSDTSAPETPVESSDKPPKFSRQDSKKSEPSTPVESTEPQLLRQDSKKSKVSETPEAPVESSEKPLSRQDSKKSEPGTPTEGTKPQLGRQDSKKSEPGTPTEGTKPQLGRQDSKKSEPGTPTTEVTEPQLVRQDSKKSKASEGSAPQTPTDTSTTAPTLKRQDSVKKKPKKDKEVEQVAAISEEKVAEERKTEEKKPPAAADKRKAEEDTAKTKVQRQDSAGKKESEDKSKSKQGEESGVVPTIIMSEDASGSDARMESFELGDDNTTLASESFRSDDSMTPPGSDFDPMDKPRFSKTLRGVTCTLGETAVLECQTEGSPEPSVTWLRDNQKIVKSERVVTSSKGQKHSLTLKDVSADDGGLYTVVATSSKGSASCSAPLNLKLSLLGLPKEDSRPTTPGGTVLPHAPVFKVKLNKETQLLEGTSVRFELVVRGHPEPEVKFLKDGKVLKLDDRVRVVYESKEVFELILDHVVAKDAGTYTIIATNAEGEDKTVGSLSVVKHKDVFKGLELEEVEREPTPRPKTPKFRWFKDGQFFEANERFQVIFNEEEDSLALMFQHVTPEDAGLYTCVASTSTGSKIACSAELTVQGVIRQVEAPSIKAELADAEATEGGSAMLELKITGFPKPKVTWYHKNKEVSTGGRIRFLFADDETYTLVIKNVKKDDSGKYSVKAANEMGEAESACKLTVKSAPSFLKGLKDMSVMAEELLKFEVEIDGNPAPEVKWYKDGQPLAAGDRVKIVDNAGKQSLQIANAKPSDSGSYSCVLTNNLGNQAEFSNVVVKASPTFAKGMENVEGLEGDTLKFNVEVNGNPKPTLKWSKDGKDLPIDGQRIKVTEEGGNAYTLTIQKATPADVGVYTCELRNEHGLKASSGNLHIKTKPEFIKKLSDMEATEGDLGLILNTTLKGYPAPSVKWFLGESDLKSDSSYIITSENNNTSHSLKVKKVNRNNAGKFTCEASNEMGKASTSGVLSVSVTVKKPEIEQELKPTQLVEGKPGKLVAKVSGEPKPKITWLKDGKPISLNGRFSMEEAEDGTVSLLISNVTPDDAGLYSLVATSDEGEASSQAPVSTIPAGKKPEFMKELEKQDLTEGQPLRLEAKVTGKPTSIKWQKDGEDLSDDGRIQLTESPDGTIILAIDKAKQTDAGKYTVIASNAEGKARSASLVQVQAMKKPEIVGSLEPLTIKDGETGQLKIKASGVPKPTITWLKDGKVLRPTNRVESIEEEDGTMALVIKNARAEDAGSYTALVQNSLGEAKSAAPVAVEQAPTFQKPLEPVNVVEGYPAKLQAKLAGSPPPEIKWMKDGEEVVPDNEHVREIRSPDGTVALLIDNCKPEDAGKYSLTAKNPLGESSSSGKLGVSSKESDSAPSAPCFVSPIGNLTVKEGEPIRFEAEISGNPLPDISWVVNDRPLTPSDNTLLTFDGEKAILEIRSSTPDHIGTYQCKLSNRLGEVSSEGSVSVQEKTAPRFIQRLNDFNGFVNQPLRLSCKVTGYPEPEVDWYFNGDLITPANPKYHLSSVGEMHTLSIPSCRPEDNGVFECKARNAVGEDHTRSAVNISDKVERGEAPMFLKKIGDNEVMEGMTAKFTACITGTPTPEVSWFKDGQPLEPSPRHKMELESTGILRLIVREVEEGDYGDYSVTLANAHGSATSSAKLCPDSLDPKYLTPIGDQFIDFDKFKKTGIPVPLSEKPRIVRMDDDSLTLGWKPSVPTCPRVPVTYQLEMAKHPDGEWTPYKTGLKDTLCDVRGLRPGQDYKFQIRVENKHGVSDPSPYVTARRSKIYQPPSPADFKPKDFSVEHPPLTKYAAPPKFVRQEEDVMYGARGLRVTIEFWVYGEPQPQVTWFKGESQIGKDKYNFMQDRNGKLCVFIDCMTDDYVGIYTCVAVNDEGEATMKIKLLIAEPPVFLERLDETTAMSRRSARMQCSVTGLPYPKIKWFRDWHPLYESERVKILWEEPDKCTLFISNLITRDNALYSCTATNIAGTATSSASLNVEEAEDMFDYKTYCRPTPVRPRTKLFEDFYDIGDELGRGTQAITYHAVKRETGDSYAAKSMHGKGKLKEFMKAELDIMNQLCHPKLVRLRDAFETKDTLTLLTDICGGGELLNNIVKRGGVTERDIANYVRQILEGLDYMHSRYVGHLGLTIGDVMVSRVNSDDIRFGDFSLAARLLPGKDHFLEYGHPEFVAPEIANKHPATTLADMWSVGVMTYLLLSGISPFLGEHDRETLTRVQQGKINFIEDAFTGVSDDAKDFMSKLLVFDPKERMDVKSALQHRWIKYYLDKPTGSERLLNNLDRLKDYQRKWRDWYANASCKRFFRRRTLESCFHHPSKMIYPPGECYTPSSSPEPMELDRTHAKPSHFDDVTFRQKINREDIDFRSESSYQNGPDTYLLQLRDTDFPLRLRQYLRVGASTSPSIAASLRDKHWGDSTLVIRERRKFVDMMDEEIDDEKKGLTNSNVPRRLYHETGTLGFAHEQMEQLKREVWKGKSREIEIGMAPFFREKVRNATVKENEEVVFRCYAVGQPKVDYNWFRNDGILLESSRIVVKELKDGRCELRINPTRAYDIGVYKCVARNMHGVTCCRARLKLGSKPGRPEKPVIKSTSDTEIYVTWAVPRDEGNCSTLGYTLEYKKSDEDEWTLIMNNIEHEYFVVRKLEPETFYQFRVKAYNRFGWGEFGLPTEPVTTKPEGAPKVKVSPRRKYQQEFTERTPEYELEESEIPELDYDQETNPVPLIESSPLDLYRIVSEMDRGRFSVVLNVWVKESNTSSIAKVIQKAKGMDGKQEYEVMKSLCHERIVTLLSASHHEDKTVLIMEKLSGVDVMSYLALRHDYNEEMVVTIIKQVLDALEYLHDRGICYIELQPDNVVMVNLRDPDIKLVDFASARYVPKSGAKVQVEGTPEYLAPEVLKGEEVSSLTDVWCVGVLTYILLSGVSPFAGKDEEETRDNVKFVRYHFDSLPADTTAEVTRFLLNIFKQCPIKRLTVEECLEHKWMAPSEYMIMKREGARFLPDKLIAFAKKFHAIKYEAMNPEMLTSLGMASSKNELKIDDFL